MDFGEEEICEANAKTEMKMIGPDLWQLTFWPRSFYALPDGATISEILANFQDESGNTVVKNVSGNDFQILAKCF